jgi:hypothetical protein
MTKTKGQKDNQPSTKHAHETKDRVTRTPVKTEGELRCFGYFLFYVFYSFSYITEKTFTGLEYMINI